MNLDWLHFFFHSYSSGHFRNVKQVDKKIEVEKQSRRNCPLFTKNSV